jgi:hypothetical protein
MTSIMAVSMAAPMAARGSCDIRAPLGWAGAGESATRRDGTSAMRHKRRQAHQRRHNRYTQAGDKTVDYAGTNGGKHVTAPGAPGGRPQAAAARARFPHRPCGHQNSHWPAETTAVPSIHRPYDYGDSSIHLEASSKPARRPRATRAFPAVHPHPGPHAVALRHRRGSTRLTQETVMTHTESGGGSQ